ncbi:hypothetical protein RIF29_05776 [Crotalaria pallida]|uniref:Secreted protein n=1 Tax=Crotalaria pallida TaxID=3830 RepID=A0AAN9PAH6_CROPI
MYIPVLLNIITLASSKSLILPSAAICRNLCLNSCKMGWASFSNKTIAELLMQFRTGGGDWASVWQFSRI